MIKSDPAGLNAFNKSRVVVSTGKKIHIYSIEALKSSIRGISRYKSDHKQNSVNVLACSVAVNKGYRTFLESSGTEVYRTMMGRSTYQELDYPTDVTRTASLSASDTNEFAAKGAFHRWDEASIRLLRSTPISLGIIIDPVASSHQD